MIAVTCLDGERPPLRLTARGAALRQAFGDPILADRIALDHRRAGLDERRTAILDYAVKATERPLDCTPEDIACLEGPWPDGIRGLKRRAWGSIARISEAGWFPAGGTGADSRTVAARPPRQSLEPMPLSPGARIVTAPLPRTLDDAIADGRWLSRVR
jgi:hypothetical protein